MMRRDLEYSSSDEETLKKKFSKKFEKSRMERLKQREKEKEEDNINARKEFEIMYPGVATAEEKMKQAQELEQRNRENEEDYQLRDHKDVEIKVNISEEIKIIQRPKKYFGAEEDEEDPLYKRTHKPLELPLIIEETQRPAPQEIIINESTFNNKLKHYKTLLEKVPKKRSELYSFPIAWNNLAQNRILEKKLGPFVSKLLVEYIGQDDRSLVQMVTKMVVNRDDPSKIQNKIEHFLDEVAEVRHI
jgi:PWI domain